MYPTWPMVFAALVAGALGGFMIPDRPGSSAASAPTPAQATAGRDAAASKDTGSTVATPADKAGQPREVAVTRETATRETGATEPAGEATATPASSAAAESATKSCVTEEWPYRAPDCIDRTASVAEPRTTVTARRVEPVDALGNMAAANEDEESDGSAFAAAVLPAPAAAQTLPEQVPTPVRRPSQAQLERQRAERQFAERQYGERHFGDRRFRQAPPAGRVYVQGPDGRIYLAPEHRRYAEPRYRYGPPPPGYRW